jgi:hypothetical protein
LANDRVDHALRDLVKMISSERDARRADVRGLQGSIKSMQEILVNMGQRMDEADERTSGFELAVIDTLGEIRTELSGRGDQLEALERRVTKIEERLDDKAS